MATHELKVWLEYYPDIENGSKKFELRYNDRDYKVGDVLRLREYNQTENYYTDREITKTIEYILDNTQFGLKENWIVMGIV